jgi:Holliday junction DNA helicase RuvA
MIACLRGTLLEKHPNQAVLDCGGVGYDVTISVATFSALPDAGATVALRVHTHVREDAIQLFGFLEQNEKALFEKLIGVSGIGPKLAITALSGLRAAELTDAIRMGDIARLTRVPGIGKKTAERVVLELRDKLGGGALAPAAPLSAVEEDVISALLNLGSQRPAAEAAVRKALAAGIAREFDPLFRKCLELVR